MLASLYYPADSWLHRMDARVKLALMVCGLILIFVTGNVWLMALLVAAGQGVLVSAHIAHDRIRGIWRAIWITVVLVFVLWVLFYPDEGPAFFSWWHIHLTWAGLARGAVIALRLAAVALVLFAWLFTTSETHLTLSLHWLGLPYVWCLTLAMALRYVPTMAELFRMTEEAQQARGLDLTHSGLLARARAYVPITVAMLISALRTATNLAHALDARALGAVPQRTWLHRLHMRGVDWRWLLAGLAITAIWLTLRYRVGWGAAPLRLWA